MSNVCAAIGRGQMTVLDTRIAQRRANYAFYLKQFGAVSGFSFGSEPEGCFSNRWLSTVRIDPAITGGLSRETLRLHLEKDNIEARPLWKPMHLQPIFADAPAYLNGVSEQLFEQGLCLPSGSNLLASDLDRIAEQIHLLLNR